MAAKRTFNIGLSVALLFAVSQCFGSERDTICERTVIKINALVKAIVLWLPTISQEVQLGPYRVKLSSTPKIDIRPYDADLVFSIAVSNGIPTSGEDHRIHILPASAKMGYIPGNLSYYVVPRNSDSFVIDNTNGLKFCSE